jgi:hypothetical protein
MRLSPGPDYRRYLHLISITTILEITAPLVEHFYMGLSAMVLIYTVSYGTIAGTWLPETAI